MKTKQAHRRRQVARIVDGVRVLPGFRSYPMLYVSSAVRSRQHRKDFASVRTFLLFVGHPRSGHSLVGSLLDAHPDVVVSHELDALKYVAAGYRRSQLFTLVLEHSKANAAAGRKSWGYSYAVPGQWQGRYDRLQVVGDKRGRRTTARLAERPELLDRLADTVQVPVSVVHVIRDPIDNISTMWRRGQRTLEYQIDEYFSLCRTVDEISARVDPSRYHSLRLEDLIADPREQLADLCHFLDMRPEPGYIEACASIVFDAPRRTRDDAPWTAELVDDVQRRTRAHAWLAAYHDVE
jgi:Sulfotransferase family